MVNELKTSVLLFLVGKGISANDLKAYSKSPAELNNGECCKNITVMYGLFLPILYIRNVSE